MEVEISWIGVLLATASGMAFGALWYSNIAFGRQWKKSAHITENQMRKSMVWMMITAGVTRLIAAYVLAYVSYVFSLFFALSYLIANLQAAALLWLGMVATTVIMNYGFEQRPPKLTWLTIGYHLGSLLLMALVLGLIGV